MKKKILIITLWLVIWQLLSFVVHNSILLVGPVEAFHALGEMVKTQEFWKSLAVSFEKITGGKLLKAACLEPKEGVNDIKAFFHKAGWMPYYLEYAFNDGVKTNFHDIAEFFFDDVELYMDMSEFLSYLRLPMAVRLI